MSKVSSPVRPAQIEEDLAAFRAEQTDVTLTVYDLVGRKVATLAAGVRSAGRHRARLEGTALPTGRPTLASRPVAVPTRSALPTGSSG
jgi:hypothetical protein